MKVADELGYEANPIARALASVIPDHGRRLDRDR